MNQFICPFMGQCGYASMQGAGMPSEMIPGGMMPGDMVLPQGGMVPQGVLPGMGAPMGVPETYTAMPEAPYTSFYAPMGSYAGMVSPMDMEDELNGEEEEEMEDGVVNDPPPILSNNPAVLRTTLYKELSGYNNYGNPSGNADILYTGNRGVWTFRIPPTFPITANRRAQLLIRAVLDDHSAVPTNRYSATITVNGDAVHTGRVPLEHGVPSGGRFTNWKTLTFNVKNLRRNNRIVIRNTSNTGPGDWIGLDWMELRIL